MPIRKGSDVPHISKLAIDNPIFFSLFNLPSAVVTLSRSNGSLWKLDPYGVFHVACARLNVVVI
jgi:hypothetical protein